MAGACEFPCEAPVEPIGPRAGEKHRFIRSENLTAPSSCSAASTSTAPPPQASATGEIEAGGIGLARHNKRLHEGDVAPLCDDWSCGSGDLSEPLMKGVPKWPI